MNETFYESTLTILQVDQFDYGDYMCTAENRLGTATSANRLTVFSHPDPPTNFRTVNLIHNRVVLTWTPGFDGGKTIIIIIIRALFSVRRPSFSNPQTVAIFLDFSKCTPMFDVYLNLITIALVRECNVFLYAYYLASRIIM